MLWTSTQGLKINHCFQNQNKVTKERVDVKSFKFMLPKTDLDGVKFLKVPHVALEAVLQLVD